VTAAGRFRAVQDARFTTADAAQFAWTTRDPGFAPVEDALLGPRLAALPFPCLEMGCGEGTNLARLVPRGRPVGTDRYLEKVRFAAHALPAARVAVAEALAQPFRDGSFAGVLIRDLLHHLESPAPALREALRLLVPGGRLLVIEPNGRNPLVALQARLVPSEAALRRFTPDTVLSALAGLPASDVRLEMAQAFPLRRLVLHYRFGLPALGRFRPTAALLAAFESLGGRVLPERRWSYAVITARRV
jgi:SAM-dependent methyltransferase